MRNGTFVVVAIVFAAAAGATVSAALNTTIGNSKGCIRMNGGRCLTAAQIRDEHNAMVARMRRDFEKRKAQMRRDYERRIAEKQRRFNQSHQASQQRLGSMRREIERMRNGFRQ
ncbi:MAG: hypothetical protein AAGD43_32520 [Pseudomonadota bacterium]